jgi:hypothetical protein
LKLSTKMKSRDGRMTGRLKTCRHTVVGEAVAPQFGFEAAMPVPALGLPVREWWHTKYQVSNRTGHRAAGRGAIGPS